MVSRTPRPHFTPGKDTVPVLQEAGWALGPVWTGGKSRSHRDLILGRPARSQSLYRLSYPAHISWMVRDLIPEEARYSAVIHSVNYVPPLFSGVKRPGSDFENPLICRLHRLLQGEIYIFTFTIALKNCRKKRLVRGYSLISHILMRIGHMCVYIYMYLFVAI